MDEFPFKEHQIEENIFIRTFLNDIESEDLVWHRDREDRIIESVETTNWMIQLDDQLPKEINAPTFIPMGVYHRLIKGDKDLKLKVIKIKK